MTIKGTATANKRFAQFGRTVIFSEALNAMGLLFTFEAIGDYIDKKSK